MDSLRSAEALVAAVQVAQTGNPAADLAAAVDILEVGSAAGILAAVAEVVVALLDSLGEVAVDKHLVLGLPTVAEEHHKLGVAGALVQAEQSPVVEDFS